MRQFETKRPGERVTLTVDFADALPPGVTASAVQWVTIATWRGSDEAPEGLLQGAPALVGSEVLQLVEGGLAGVDYLVVAKAALSDGQTRECPVILPVREWF